MCPAIGVTGYLKGRDRQTQPLRILVSWRIIERRYIHRQTHESSLSARAGKSVITRRRGTREIQDRALEMEKLTGGIIKLPFRRERDLSVHHVPICVSDNRYANTVETSLHSRFREPCATATFFQRMLPVASGKGLTILIRIEYACFLAIL